MMSWDKSFCEPAPLPGGGKLTRLRKAGDYIRKFPHAEADKPARQTAMRVLQLAADHQGPVDFAHIGLMQALYTNAEPVYHLARSEACLSDRFMPKVKKAPPAR